MNAAFDQPRNDLGVAVIAVCVPDQGRNLKRRIHHETVHASPPANSRYAPVD
jgi:hypothetical protein